MQLKHFIEEIYNFTYLYLKRKSITQALRVNSTQGKEKEKMIKIRAETKKIEKVNEIKGSSLK